MIIKGDKNGKGRWDILDRRLIGVVVVALVALGAACGYLIWQASKSAVGPSPTPSDNIVELPEPRHDSDVSIEEVLLSRRSVREYTGEPLTLQDVSQLLWAAQGITDPRGYRTAPSAGGTYPLEVYMVVGDVEGLAEGVYKYNPSEHEIIKILDGDKREELYVAVLEQTWVKEAAIDMVIAAVYERTTERYGERGVKYVHMEAGHAAQNLYLQATALNLGTVTVGAFHDEQVKELLNMPENVQPLYVMPVGKK